MELVPLTLTILSNPLVRQFLKIAITLWFFNYGLDRLAETEQIKYISDAINREEDEDRPTICYSDRINTTKKAWFYHPENVEVSKYGERFPDKIKALFPKYVQEKCKKKNLHSNKNYLKYPVFPHANINETGYWFVQIDGIPNIISLDAGIQYKYRYTKPLIMDPLEAVEDRLARVRRENEYNKAHQQEFEKVHMLPIEKMYEVPGTPKWLSVSNTWKINSTLPFYNITNFHLLMKIEVKKPVKKFWLTWCFQRPMKESEMPKCSVPGSHPSFCRDVY